LEAKNMFGTLLESRAKRRRRLGGAAVSVAAHLTIIGAITATAVHGGTVKKERPEAVLVRFPAPEPPRPRPVDDPPVPRASTAVPTSFSTITIRHIDAPTTVPVDLPPINASVGAASDSIVIGRGTSSSPLGRDIIGAFDQEGTNEWSGAELQTRILTSAKPRYPESLRQAAIDGAVLVRFAIDTTGRVDMSSVAVVSSTHDLFSRAVRDALPGFRFKPAAMGGRRVRALAEMPFEFQITR
jgi:TonB family protein